MNIFEKAVRAKLRFPTGKGAVSVEDLWDLPLIANGLCLDHLYQELNRELENSQSSFYDQLTNTKKSDSKTRLMFDIVIHVMRTKHEESELAKMAAEDKVKKQRIMEIMAGKQDEELSNKSMDELQKILDGL